jgi:hypothetical protein
MRDDPMPSPRPDRSLERNRDVITVIGFNLS